MHTPKLKALEVYLNDIEPLLIAWGQWSKTGVFLGYKNTFYEKRGYDFNNEEMELTDKILCELKTNYPSTFKVIKWRYVERYSYREIMKLLKKRSPKQAGIMIDMALNIFTNIIREKINEPERVIKQ